MRLGGVAGLNGPEERVRACVNRGRTQDVVADVVVVVVVVVIVVVDVVVGVVVVVVDVVVPVVVVVVGDVVVVGGIMCRNTSVEALAFTASMVMGGDGRGLERCARGERDVDDDVREGVSQLSIIAASREICPLAIDPRRRNLRPGGGNDADIATWGLDALGVSGTGRDAARLPAAVPGSGMGYSNGPSSAVGVLRSGGVGSSPSARMEGRGGRDMFNGL